MLLWIDLLSLITVEGLQLAEHLYLRHSCLTVAVYVFNDLQSHSSSITGNTQYKYFLYQMEEERVSKKKISSDSYLLRVINAFDNLPKGTLS